jgi:site-specific recombinase XerD
MQASVPSHEARLGTRQFSGTISDNITLSDMTDSLTTTPTASLPTVADQAADRARAYVRASRAENTRRAYAADWRNFTAWAASAGLAPLPASPETVGLYLAAEASRLRPGTLARHLVAVTAAHRAAGHQLDSRAAAIRETLTGIKRTHGTQQLGKAPVLVTDLKAMIDAQPDTLVGLRNRALLLLGFAGALRRSELVSLDVDDLDFTSDGLVVTLRRAKTDQDGQGRQVGVPYGRRLKTCPVRSLQSWLEVAGITSGAIFREITRGDRLANAYVDKSARQRGQRLSDKTVALVVKRAAKAAGLDPKRYAGHSLRGGLATSAAAAGASERSIMATTGHRSVQMVRRYIRIGELFRENAAATVGL